MRQYIGAIAVLSFAATQTPAQMVSVRGVAYDSLRGMPLSGAFVGIAGTTRSTTSDSRGRFRFDSVPAGQHVFTMQHDVLDSIGFSGRSARAQIDANNATVTIAVPSFATLWRALCGGVAPKDSAMVYGVVRDAADVLVSDAVVGVTWRDVSVGRNKSIDWKDMGGSAKTDSTGRYALCGLPTEAGLHLAAGKDSLTSGVVDLPPVTLRVIRRDFRIVKHSPNEPFEVGTVMGTVSREDGAPVANAMIVSDSVEEVRSDSLGRFTMRNVPAGTRQVEIRAMGATPVAAIVDVAPNDTTHVALTMSKVQTLAEVKVTAPTFKQVMIRNIEERKRLGLGYFRDSTAFKGLAIAAQGFDGVAGLRVVRLRGTGFALRSTRPGCGGFPLAIWIDRVRLDESVLASHMPEDFATVEVYLSTMMTPPEFLARGTCGAVVVFTKRYLRG